MPIAIPLQGQALDFFVGGCNQECIFIAIHGPLDPSKPGYLFQGPDAREKDLQRRLTNERLECSGS